MIKKIIKRDGTIVSFDRSRISFAVLQAAVAVGGRDKKTAEAVTDDVVRLLEKMTFKGGWPTVEEVQDLVEKCLIERGHAKTAKAYILYRYEHTLKRAGKASLTYSSENIPYRKLWQTLSWAADNTCVTLSQINQYISENRFQKLIRISEDFYNAEIEAAAQEIEKRLSELRIIIIAGPSASGKSTTAFKILEAFQKKGVRFVPLVVDNYFFDLTRHPRDSSGDYDFETPQALDLGMINAHLKELIAGKEVKVPYYDFKLGRQDGFSKTLKLADNEILVIDSLHGMYEEMTADIPASQKFRLYIETLSQVKDNDLRFIRWTDIRMMRRMVRDSKFRNYKSLETITHWQYVRRSEMRYIISRLQSAHAIVNSFLAYELPVLKYYLEDVFPGIEQKLVSESGSADAIERVMRINRLFSQVAGWSGNDEIPANSLLREFIGGSKYQYI